MSSDFRKDPEDAAVNSGHSIEATVIPPVEFDSDCHAGVKRSLRRRNGIDYCVFDYSSEEELNDVIRSMKSCQSKRCHQANGVRGSTVCSEHEVSAKWSPKKACRPFIDEAPVFYPSEEEFRDTLSFIASIRPTAEKYGICRIIPPPSWKPPCPLKDKNIWENSKFSTRVQQVDKLQNREPMRKKIRNRCQRKRKRRKRLRFGMTRRRNSCATAEIHDCPSDTDEKFGFRSGSDFTLQSFQIYAENFKERYFGGADLDSESCCNGGKRCQPSVDEIEGEYWRIVENPADEVEVLYGADLETGIFGSGFPKANLATAEDLDPHIYSGWNLNNFPRLPGSVLSFESGDISGVLVPWLYIGMCFSSFCWHVEDHHLYSLNYMHWGDPKIWYGVPGAAAVNLEEAMRKHLPELFEEQPDLLHELVTQLSPSVLKSNGVPVYRAVQKAGEFVLTFPRAYHAGFNCGFNCAEAVNVAPMDWLPHGQCAVELYREQRRKTSISHDKLLMGAAREAVRAMWEISLLGLSNSSNLKWQSVCGKEGVLTKAIRARVAVEKELRELHCDSTKAREMNMVDDSSKERECFVCFYDLHLSAASCECSLDRYACLAHAELLCSCKPRQVLLFIRYSIDQLNTLVRAMEGCLNAVQHWGAFDLGFVSPSAAAVTNTSKGLVDISISSGEYISDAIIHQRESNSTECLEVLKEDFDSGQLSMSRNDSDSKSSEILKRFETSCVKTESERGNFSKSASCITPDFLALQQTEYMGHRTAPKKIETFSADGFMEEDLRWHLDLNKECLNKDESSEAMKTINKQDCSSSEAKQEQLLLMATDSCQEGKSEIEHEFMKRTGTPLRSSPDVRSSFSHGNPFDFSPFCPSQNGCRNEVSLSKGFQPKAKLFGFELQRHQQLQPVNSIAEKGWPSSSSLNSNELNSHSPQRQKHFTYSKYIVEPLHLGSLMFRKHWCNATAIFPKGFQSRVRYYSILDPTVTCSYISEVLDAGLIGPLFKVTLEDSPEDIFMHSSPTHCWDMVRERLNQEIIKQFNSSNKDLPPLQPPGSINGLEMFGFLSPSIRQEIESIDPFYEYWASKLTSSIILETEMNTTMKPIEKLSVGCASTSHKSIPNASSENRGMLFGTGMLKFEQTDFTSGTEVQQHSLGPLLSRLKQDELLVLHKVFRSGSESETWRAAYQAVMHEIEKNAD